MIAQLGTGALHTSLQQHFREQVEKFRVSQKALEDEEALKRVFGALDGVLYCVSVDQVHAAEKKALDAIQSFVSNAWQKKLAKGPATPHRLEEEAKKKESFAKWRLGLGGEDNKEKAKKALAEAKTLREQADAMQREAEEKAEAERRAAEQQEDPSVEYLYFIPKRLRKPGERGLTTDPNWRQNR